MSDIKSAQQRVRKATEECDKLKEKLKKAQARLAVEKGAPQEKPGATGKLISDLIGDCC
ncbi:MAG: hypothetical protein ABSD98_13455 [Candidatus Korobacteraceae bacterium]